MLVGSLFTAGREAVGGGEPPWATDHWLAHPALAEYELSQWRHSARRKQISGVVTSAISHLLELFLALILIPIASVKFFVHIHLLVLKSFCLTVKFLNVQVDYFFAILYYCDLFWCANFTFFTM